MNQAKEEEYFIPSEEANEVERLLLEPQKDGVSVDGILSSRDDKLKQGIEMKDVTYSFGWSAYNATEEGEDISKLNALDAVPLQVEGGNHLSTTCEDYLLESVSNLDYNASKRLNFDNSVSESLLMEFIHPDNQANWLNYPNCESRNIEKMDENETNFSLDLKTKNSAHNSNSSGIVRQKRLRKPTRRYMDESSDLNSGICKKRPGDYSTSTSKDRFKGVKFRKNHREVAPTDESFCKAIQVPFSPRGEKEFQKKPLFTEMQTYIEESSSSAELEYGESVKEVKSEKNGLGGVRKHHKLWTLSEVRMLIDGVSQHGVGKWTQIKKLLFSSSPHRTPVDLKDKWRNLLKASSAQKPSKGEDERKRNQPWRPLPKSMLSRVSELAAIYPYPRGNSRKFNLSHLN